MTLCVTAQRVTARGGRWSVEGCIPTQSVGTIMKLNGKVLGGAAGRRVIDVFDGSRPRECEAMTP